ncbi:MAG TPA: non-canonical purine NTP pyrophosphatase [Ktedonobacteraceae bacterium]|nr:non-canonical purine NTP pyrophosphatase [Ktedonobacteraceae bacterium]
MIKELIIGTSNAAKKKAIGSVLAPLGITVKGTDDLAVSLYIVEDGATAQENARKKALAYAGAIGRPVFSIDNALYLQGLSDEEQAAFWQREIGKQIVEFIQEAWKSNIWQ